MVSIESWVRHLIVHHPISERYEQVIKDCRVWEGVDKDDDMVRAWWLIRRFCSAREEGKSGH